MGVWKWTRRAFLVASVAVAGGVAFGVWQGVRSLPNPLEGDGALNPWLVIDADGIRVVVPRAEMGQGITTTLAALVAEELDADLSQITVIHGPPAQVYYNGALMAGAVGGPHWARSSWGEWLGEQAGVIAKVLGLQVTGGSTSTADAFDKMRQAGASAREALKAAAAARLGVDAGSLRTESAHVIAPDGSRIPYADLAAAAAQIDPPTPALRDASQWRLLGKSQPRTDMVAKVTGTAVFASDIRLPGMKFATVKRNPGLGAAMLSHDPAPALALPGVERVVPLADGFAVIANTTWAAMQGAEAVAVQWAPAPYPANDASQLARLEAAFADDPNDTPLDVGDIATPPAGASVVQAEYRVPYLAHSTMEPMSAAALFQDGRLTLWAGSQAPGFAAANAAKAIGIEADAVTMHTTLLGGGFGRRAETDFSTIAAQVAAAVPTTPVLVSWSREEDMTHDVYRPAALARGTVWVQGGRMAGMDLSLSAPAITAQTLKRMTGMGGGGPDRPLTEGAWDQPYAIPNARVRGYAADLAVPVGFWRSVGHSQNCFFLESLIDEAAHAAGADPLEFRLAHMRDVHAPSAAVLEAVADLSGWRAGKRPGTGRGVAFCHSFGTAVAQVIEVERRGTAIAMTRAFIACDPGIALDPAIIEAQMIGGMVYGLSAAMLGEITFADGAVQERNFPDYDALRQTGMPDTQVRIVASGHGIGGVGEPGTPPAAPALANALFDLTGQRVRRLPLRHAFDLVV
jgi:isoquinoline 1-oxidoreductase subunit beta